MKTKIDHRFFPLIFDSIAHGIFTIDSTGRITSFNRMARDLTGYALEEVLGRRCSTIFRADRCERSCPLKSSIHTGEAAEVDNVHIISRTGQTMPVAISTAALTDEHGTVIGGVEMFRDLRLVSELRKRLEGTYVFEDIVAKSHCMSTVLRMIPLVANNRSTVLISGESGTGKELVARAIHNLGPRSDMPFVAVNCGAIPDSLLESELFGYKRGAFTDAKQDKPGRFANAEGGTLLLDEIGDISKRMQVKLLRVLQEMEYEPLGATETVKADVRVIASTNRELERDVADGRFRSDLYYRLNVVQMKLPPLRERWEDIPLLVEHFVNRFNIMQGRRISRCSERVMSALMRYPFPGNIRELENAIEYAFVVCADNIIQVTDLPQQIVDYHSEHGRERRDLRLPLEDAESQTVRDVLEQNGYNRSRAARQLGVSRNTLWRKMKKYGITTPPSNAQH